jgi:hypothetical protein
VPYRTDARLMGRHPFQILIMFMLLLISIPVLLGVTQRPGSIAAILPPPAGLIWSITLTVGTALALVGVFWRDRARGLILEQLGLGFVGLASSVYGVAILLSRQDGAAVAIALIFGLAGASFWRYCQIQRLLNKAKLTADTEIATRKALRNGGH